MIEQYPPSPLVTIVFQSLDGPALTRYWYHVPRIGDSVVVIDGEVEIIGTVTGVRWEERAGVTVVVK